MKTTTIGKIADVQTGPFGSQLHKEDYVTNGTPIVTVEHLGQKTFTTQNLPRVSTKDKVRLAKYTMHSGDIIFSRVGSVDRCSFATENNDGWLFSGRCLRLRVADVDVNSEYLYYYFCQEAVKELIRNHAVGATMPSLNTKLLSELPFSYPGKEQQTKIVSLLSDIDAKIERNASINQNLEAQAQAIFKSWFVDFEPFQDGKFVDSELGPIPQGWRVVSLEDIAFYNNEKLPASKAMLDTYISTDNMLPNRGGIELASNVPSTGCVTVFAKNDVLLSNIRPYFRKIWYASLSGTCSTDVLCFRAKAKVESEYLFCVLNNESFFEYVMSGAKGTKMPRGDKRQMMSYRIVMPYQDILENFSRTLKPLVDHQRRNTIESRCLAALRDTLLPKLMSGEIDVSDVNILC